MTYDIRNFYIVAALTIYVVEITKILVYLSHTCTYPRVYAHTCTHIHRPLTCSHCTLLQIGICMYGGTILLGHCPGEDTAMDAQTIIEVCTLHHNYCADITIGSRLIWGRADGY